VGVNADTLLLIESELPDNREMKTANATASTFLFGPFLNNDACTIGSSSILSYCSIRMSCDDWCWLVMML
jgi:hypothetical protein